MLSRRETLRRLAILGGGMATAAPALELTLTPIGTKTLRITLARAGEKLAADPVLALPAGGKPWVVTHSAHTFKWGRERVRVTADPWTISVDKQTLRIDSTGSVTFKASAGPVFGLGEGGQQFDRRAQQYTMRNGQFRPDLANIGARLPIPWLISADGWALFFHQPFGTIDLTGGEYRFEASSLPLDFFFVSSAEPTEVLREYARITGFPHMPPLWSLGYQQSHRTLASRAEVLDEARRFRDDKLPCDTMIYLGTGFCPSGWNTGHGSFTFNNAVFPDPKAIIDELHEQHFHVILHLTMPPDGLSGSVSDTGAAAEDPNNAAHYWATHLDTLRLGVDGWWPDEGDKLPPESRLARNRMYWEGSRKQQPQKRPFALHRNGYAGMQRYGWLWSGDVDCTWKTLGMQIPVGLNTGLSGIPYWGTDTGGFVTTKELTGELYVRWFQFSAFCPLFRSHGRTWKLRLPWGWNTGELGPEEVPANRLPDASELHNAQVEPICRKYLELRSRLLPYTYSAVREAHETGLPVMRALWLHYPGDSNAVKRSDQYLWGRDILVAPVTQAGATSKEVYLPPGSWYDFWTGEFAAGGKVVERPVDLATLPLYVRAGAILPLRPVKQYVTQSSEEPLTVRIHPGSDGEFILYADDGETYAQERGEFMKLSLQWNDKARRLRLALLPGSKTVWPDYRNIEVELLHAASPKRIEFEGKPIELVF